jgi:ABC-type proline/glycine betaine transport system permease subunit
VSAWRVGSEAGPDTMLGEEQPSAIKAWIDKVTKWIPGDILAFFLAAITSLQQDPKSKPSIVLLVVMWVVTPLAVLGGAFASGKPLTNVVWVSALLAAIAFGIWSLTVPFSGWQRLDVVGDNPRMVAIIAGIAGFLFGFLADGVVQQLKPKP